MNAPIAAKILSLNNIEVVYDHVSLAIKGVSIDVPEGGMVALLGANGAGKSTTLKSISGLLTAERGEVRRGELQFRGQSIGGLMPQDRVKLGIAHVLEGRRVFEHLTPDENLIAASALHSRQDMNRNKDRVYSYFPRLHERRTVASGYLSGGEQQMLAIGRALMSRPRLLLLDEPSLGLAPLIARQIFDAIRTLNRQDGLTVLIVEQNANHALKLAHRGYVMVNGLITLAGTGAELLQRPEIRAAYLEGGRHG